MAKSDLTGENLVASRPNKKKKVGIGSKSGSGPGGQRRLSRRLAFCYVSAGSRDIGRKQP